MNDVTLFGSTSLDDVLPFVNGVLKGLETISKLILVIPTERSEWRNLALKV